MIDIENELEDIVPTYDADVDLIQLLKDSTTLGTDDEGNQIPGYIFAKDLADMLEMSENDMAMFAFENGYDIFNAVIDGEDTAMEMLVICAKGFDHEIIKNDYEEIFDLKIELKPVESFDDSEDNEIETKQKSDTSQLISKQFLNDFADSVEESAKRESLRGDKKELNYLLRKEEVASLDKEERMRLHLLIQKYGRPDNELDEAVEDKTSDEIKDRIDSITTKQIPEVESRINKYKEEQSKTKDEKVIRTLNNKIKDAEKQVKELQKRKEKLEIDFKTAKENEDRKNREELEARIEKEISPGKGKRLKENPQIKITKEEKKSYDDFIDFLQDNTVSIRFDVASKREKFFRYLLPEIKDNQYNVISGKLESGQDKKWGISAVLTVKNVHLCPDSFRDYFTKGNKITENYKVIAILKTNFEVLEDKIKVSDIKEESLKEELNEIKPGTKIKLNKDTFYADIEVEGMFEDDEDLIDKFLDAGFILKGTELVIPAGSVLIFVASLSVDLYEFNGLQFEVSEWPDEFDYTIVNESVTEENELKNRAKKHKKTDRKSARGWFVNPSAGNVEQNIARVNHMMGDGSASSSATVGSAPSGLGEDVELSEMLPHEDESKTDFVMRFMSDDKMIKEYENPKQRYAVAMSYWEKK